MKNSIRFLFATILLVMFYTTVNKLSSCKVVKLVNRSAIATDFQKYSGSLKMNSSSKGEIVVRQKGRDCGKVANYYYDENQKHLSYEKKIRVNVHFINSLDSSQNFNPDTGIKYAKGLIKYANIKLDDNRKMKLPEGNDTPVNPVPFRYVLTANKSIPGDEGVYFHYVENPFFLNFGRKKNNYDRKIIKEYEVGMDSILNIFYMVHPPDSIGSKTYSVESAGIALGNSVKLGVNFLRKTNEWSYASLLNHEIGHVLSLSHAWTRSDGCEDTPVNPNCWNTGPAPCDGVISNNVMDYNSNQNSYTPCQLARTDLKLSSMKSARRNLMIKTWCKQNPEHDIVIRDTTIWNRVVDFDGNITIENGGLLVLTCHLNMAESTSITVKEGGELLLIDATIHNDCDYWWDGIKLLGSENNVGKLSYLDTFYLENVSQPIVQSLDN